jgi:hypothetical protein
VQKTADTRIGLVLIARPRDRRNEAVASPSQGRDVSCPTLTIPQRLAQTGYVNPQTAFFHGDIGPNLGQQIFLADDLVWLGQQCDQDVEGSRAQFDGGAFFRKQAFACDQLERTERHYFPSLRR